MKKEKVSSEKSYEKIYLLRIANLHCNCYNENRGIA